MEEEQLITPGMSTNWQRVEERETNVAIASSSGMLQTVAIKHGDQFLGNWQRSLQVDNSCNRQQNIHQKSTHGCLNLLSRAVQEELCTLL